MLFVPFEYKCRVSFLKPFFVLKTSSREQVSLCGAGSGRQMENFDFSSILCDKRMVPILRAAALAALDKHLLPHNSDRVKLAQIYAAAFLQCEGVCCVDVEGDVTSVCSALLRGLCPGRNQSQLVITRSVPSKNCLAPGFITSNGNGTYSTKERLLLERLQCQSSIARSILAGNICSRNSVDCDVTSASNAQFAAALWGGTTTFPL
ncbi:hypothetical protein TRVL_01344 [Trypanosoma vivax]|nr:hypothetical protein TRVL_01344 [Trypanosoma vivax]